MPTACGCVEWTFSEDMLYCFAGAGNLFLSMEGVEALGVLPSESISCDEAKQCRVSESKELNFSLLVSGVFIGLWVSVSPRVMLKVWCALHTGSVRLPIGGVMQGRLYAIVEMSRSS